MRIQCKYSEEEEEEAEEEEEVSEEEAEEEEEEAEEEEEEDCGVQWGCRGVQRGYDVPLLSSLPSVATILLPLLKRVSTCFYTETDVSECVCNDA